MDMLQTEAMVQHTVRRDPDPAVSKLLHRLALHYITQEEVNICLHVRLLRPDLFRKRALADRMRILRHLLRVQHRCPEELLLIHLLVYVHGNLRKRRLHDQEQLVIAHIPFHRVLPAFILKFQKISQDLNIDESAAPLVQTPPKFELRLL